MTTIGIAAIRGLEDTARWASAFGPMRLMVLALLVIMAGASEDAAGIIATSFTDAFLQVTVFVAVTLSIFYSLEAWFKIDATALLARHRIWQVPIAAALGALPGCGGAIMVITQYIRPSDLLSASRPAISWMPFMAPSSCVTRVIKRIPPMVPVSAGWSRGTGA